MQIIQYSLKAKKTIWISTQLLIAVPGIPAYIKIFNEETSTKIHRAMQDMKHPRMISILNGLKKVKNALLNRSGFINVLLPLMDQMDTNHFNPFVLYMTCLARHVYLSENAYKMPCWTYLIHHTSLL